MKKKFGFTLAEVLVTLGIIGVVSAMTIPTLMQNHQRTTYVTQLHKVYNELSQAVTRAITDSNAISLDETKYSGNVENSSARFLKDYFKIVNDCGTTLTPCFADSYQTINGDNFQMNIYGTTPIIAVVLASGSAIASFEQYGRGEYLDNHGYYQMYVDINGPQGPNVLGRDLFYIEVYSDGVVGESHDPRDADNLECDGTTNSYGVGCLTKIIDNGWKMDY